MLLLGETIGGSFAQAETELPHGEILSKDEGPYFLLQVFFSHFCYTLIFIYKQLWSGLSSRSCLYCQDFLGSKLLNGCLVV